MKNLFLQLIGTLVLMSMVILCSGRATAQRLIYRVDLSHIADHFIDVTVQPIELRPDTMIFQMPVWTPGIYSEVHYGRFVQDLQAFDSSGNELRILHTKPDRWKIINPNTIAKITYRVKDSHSDASSPELGLARIDANGVFANVEALFGYFDDDKSIPGTLVLTNLPKDWMVATTLDPATDGNTDGDAQFHQSVFNIDDYESFADAPLVIAPNFQTASFSQNGVQYEIVAAGLSEFPIDSFADAASHIVRAETSFYGNVPFEKYMFVIYPNENRSPFGLAHDASSVYALDGEDWSVRESATRQLIAATFFKTWNGKQFHIPQLGPVDFTAPVSAHSLWFSEGVSEYYAELLRVRYGLETPAEFFLAIENWEREADHTSTISLDGLSEKMGNYDRGRVEALRARGALAALIMDIEIRDKTQGRSSLDKVLLRMEREAPSGKTYDDNEFIKTLSGYSGIDLQDVYAHYIANAEPIPVQAYLEKMGAGREVPESMTGGEMGLNVALNAAGTAIITATSADSVTETAALTCGDTVCAIDGEAPSERSVAEAKSSIASGQPVIFTLLRNAQPVAVTLRAKKATRKPEHFTALPNASRSELTMRRALLGRRRFRSVKSPALAMRQARSSGHHASSSTRRASSSGRQASSRKSR